MNSLKVFLNTLKNFSILALVLFIFSSCSYYGVMVVMHHNPSVTYDAQTIKLCWVIFFMVTFATAVMGESFIENMVKLLLFFIIFILLFFLQSPYALHAFAALLGSFVGSIFASPK